MLVLEDFLKEDDKLNEYDLIITQEHQPLVRHWFYNNGDLKMFHAQLSKWNFDNIELVRPSWDWYFMWMAMTAAIHSNCSKRCVGAVIVDTDKQIVSTGYNGTPCGAVNCNQGGCKWCNSNARQGEWLDECVCIHAEENAVIVAGRVRAWGCTLYVTTHPCLLCSKMIVQAGIKKIFYYKDYDSISSKDFLASIPGMELI